MAGHGTSICRPFTLMQSHPQVFNAPRYCVIRHQCLVSPIFSPFAILSLAVVVVLVFMAMMGIRVVRMTVTQGFMLVVVAMASHKYWNVSVRMMPVQLRM
jgi:hypothetical protein